MRISVHKSFVALAWVGVLLGGCRAADEPAEATAPLAAESDAIMPAVQTEGTVAPDATLVGATSSEPTPAAEEPEPRAVSEFMPPFPDRIDLFEPPKLAEGVAHRNDDQGGSVELKGFVNVDGPRVVLSIDGVIAPLAEGDQKYGVQVISIQPPLVVLQRGRSRWTATLD